MLKLLSSIVKFVSDIAVIVGGVSAFVIYFVNAQNRRREEASLIVNQIESLKDEINKVKEILSGGLNEQDVYESLDLIKENYWDMYKIRFIRKIDTNSYKIINNFYEYAESIREQLQLVKQLQKSHFFTIQNNLLQTTSYFMTNEISSLQSNGDFKSLIEQLSTNNENDVQMKNIALTLVSKMNIDSDDVIINNVISRINNNTGNYQKMINSGTFKEYIPVQISKTIEKQLSKLDTLEVIGCSGFKKIKKISKIK